MPHAHAHSGLECWREAGSGVTPWRTALEKSAAMLGARAIAFGTVGDAGNTRLLGIYPSDASTIAPGFAEGLLARAENEQTGYLRSEVATKTLASATVTIWIVALLEQSNTARLLREVAQAAADAAMRVAQAGSVRMTETATVSDLTESEMHLARVVLNPGANRALH